MRLATLGLDTRAFLGRRGIEAELLADEAARVPLARTVGIWEEAAELAGDPDFGLHLAEIVQASSFGLFSYLAVTSATWGVAARRVSAYFGLISDASGYELDDSGPIVTFSSRSWSTLPPSRHLAEFALAVVVCSARKYLVRPLVVMEVTFAHDRPASTTEHERIFTAPLAFGRARSGFSFDSSWLGVLLTSADPKLASLLEPGAMAELEQLEAADIPLADRVRRVLAELLREGIPSARATAERLGMAPRSLQRRLAEAGTSFRALLQEEQRSLAERLLAQPSLSIAEVAALLGFSETAAFHRSFQRWTGTTPKRFRLSRRVR